MTPGARRTRRRSGGKSWKRRKPPRNRPPSRNAVPPRIIWIIGVEPIELAFTASDPLVHQRELLVEVLGEVGEAAASRSVLSFTLAGDGLPCRAGAASGGTGELVR